jgi:hypothetical protein
VTLVLERVGLVEPDFQDENANSGHTKSPATRPDEIDQAG